MRGEKDELNLIVFSVDLYCNDRNWNHNDNGETMSIHRSKDFAESVARQLRCCGVDSARVQKITMYEVITDTDNKQKVSL
jgi:hypothetical protein